MSLPGLNQANSREQSVMTALARTGHPGRWVPTGRTAGLVDGDGVADQDVVTGSMFPILLCMHVVDLIGRSADQVRSRVARNSLARQFIRAGPVLQAMFSRGFLVLRSGAFPLFPQLHFLHLFLSLSGKPFGY